MSERLQLLETICRHPADPLPRHIYADWLEGRTDDECQARAEFIRLGMQLEQMRTERRTGIIATQGELQRRLDALVALWHERWLRHETLPGVAVPALRSVVYRGGFVAEVQMALYSWMDPPAADAPPYGVTFCRTVPVTRVLLIDLEPWRTYPFTGNYSSRWEWYEGRLTDLGTQGGPPHRIQATVPRDIFQLMAGPYDPGRGLKHYAERAEAIIALAQAAAAWAHAYARVYWPAARV